MQRSTIERAQDQLYKAQLSQLNRDAIRELLPEWCSHISQNVQLCKRAYRLDDIPRQSLKDRCVVVAASPYLTDEEILKLKGFEGDVIVTNKNFQRLYDLGVTPSWVVLLDAHPISAQQFRWLECADRERLRKVRYWVASVIYPKTLEILMGVGNVYCFNPLEMGGDIVAECPECGHGFEAMPTVRLSETWKWMNGLDEFSHGGNVGTCAFLFAKKLMYKEIGLMGFDLYELPSDSWTMEAVAQREYLFYPGFGTVAWPTHFKAYFAYLVDAIKDTASEVRYLGTSPLFLHCPVVVSESADDFVRRGHGTT